MIAAAWRAVHEGRPGWALRFGGGAGFDLGKIERLKRIASFQRNYDEETKVWWVAQEREPDLLEIFPEMDAYLRQMPMF